MTERATELRVTGDELQACMTRTINEKATGTANAQNGGPEDKPPGESGGGCELLLWTAALLLSACDILCWSVKSLLTDLTSGAHEASAITSPAISVMMLIFAAWNVERMLKDSARPNDQAHT
jgi:hypothetical protein